MSPEPNPKDQWERVAAELRAYRDLQQQAWGDIDNATLGRYLAGEVDREEMCKVESALEELPELRKLTDLVRDVLSEFEPGIAPTPELSGTVPPPVILPFASSRPARQPFFTRLRRRSALVAAACLLLALGLGMPSARRQPAAPSSERVTALSPRSRSIDTTMAFKTPDGKRPLLMGTKGNPADALVLARMDKLDASVEELEKEGKLGEALAVARAYPVVAREARLENDPRYARSLNRVGLLYEKKGNLVEAEQSLRQACAICEKRLGPRHPETIQSVKLLAGVYQLALDAPVVFAPPLNPVNPYLPDYDSFRKRLPYVPARMAKSATPAAVAGGTPSDDEKTLAFDEGKSAWVEDLTNTDFGFDATVPGVNPVVVNGFALLTRAVQTWSAPAGARPKKAAPTRRHGEAVAFRRYLTRQRPAELKQNVVPVLVEAWQSAATPKERVSLARAFGQLGPAARPAVPALTAYLKETTDKSEQQAILRALGQMGPAARAAVPVLLTSLQSACPEARRSAAEAIVHLGPAARDTVLAYRRKIQPAAADALTLKVYQRLEGREGRIGVKDECDCFSVLALRQSTVTIQQLARTANLEVFVETVPALAPGTYAGKDCLRDMGAHGVHVVIAKQGPAVRVTVSEAVRKQGFAAEKLQKVLEERLRRKDYDGGLTEGMQMLARFESDQNTRKKTR